MKVLGAIILILLLVTIVVPVGYLAWSADQPMVLTQFKGYTYYQYLAWRKDALHQKEVAYQAAYPHAKMGGGLDMCSKAKPGILVFWPADDRFLHPGGRLPKPGEIRHAGRPRGHPEGCDAPDLSAGLVVDLRENRLVSARRTTEDPVPYCRLAATPPARLETRPLNP